MTEPQVSPARPTRFGGYGLALAAAGSFIVLALVVRQFPPPPLFLMVAVLTVGTAAAGQLFPRIEEHLAGWLLTLLVIMFGVFAIVSYPGSVSPEHHRLVLLASWSSLVAAGVLFGKCFQLLPQPSTADWAKKAVAVGAAVLGACWLVLLLASLLFHPDAWR